MFHLLVSGNQAGSVGKKICASGWATYSGFRKQHCDFKLMSQQVQFCTMRSWNTIEVKDHGTDTEIWACDGNYRNIVRKMSYGAYRGSRLS